MADELNIDQMIKSLQKDLSPSKQTPAVDTLEIDSMITSLENDLGMPGVSESFMRGVGSGVFGENDFLEMASSWRASPNQPKYSSIRQARQAMGSPWEKSKPGSTYDPELQKQYNQEQLIKQREEQEYAKSQHPDAYGSGEITGVIAPWLIPVGGEAKAASLGYKIFAEAARGAAVSAMQSDAPTGSLEWFVDVGLGAAIPGSLEAGKAGVMTGVKKLTKNGVNVGARNVEAFANFARTPAMVVKLSGSTIPQMAGRALPFGEKLFGKMDPITKKITEKGVVQNIDDTIINFLKAEGKPPPEDIFEKVYRGLGNFTAESWAATGGITTPTVGLTIGPIYSALHGEEGVSLDEYIDAYKSLGKGVGAAVLARGLRNPMFILDKLKGTKWVEPLSKALSKNGFDAFRGTMTYFAQDEDFQKTLLGEELWKKIDRMSETDDSKPSSTPLDDMILQLQKELNQ